MLAYALSTWPHLKAFLRSDAHDSLLAEAMIDAATLAIEAECKNALVIRSFTDLHSGGVNGERGGAKRIYLDRYPITEVTSIEDTEDATHTVPATDFTVLAGHGALEHVGHWPAPLKPGLWEIDYEAGRFPSIDSVDEQVRLACHLQATHWLTTPPGGVVTSTSGDGKSRTYRLPQDAELLPEVRALVRQYRRIEV